MRATCVLSLLCLTASFPAAAAAQWRTPAVDSPATAATDFVETTPSLPAFPVQDEQPESVANMIGGGVLAGALGAVAGRAMAAQGDATVGDLFLGASVGAGIGIPIGVHLTNRRRGQLMLAELASVAWTAALFTAAAKDNSVILLAAAPAGALAISVTIETRTTR